MSITIRDLITEYQRKHAVYLSECGEHGRLTDTAEISDDHGPADRHYDELLLPAMENALNAAMRLFDRLDAHETTVVEALSDARAYRLGDASNEDELVPGDPDSRGLARLDILATEFGWELG